MKNIFSFNKKKKKSEISSSKRLFIGSTLIIISLFLFISIFSYFFNGYIDQSSINYFLNDEIKSANYFGKLGAYISHYLVYMGFGIASLNLN